jgi:carbamoyltransferase
MKRANCYIIGISAFYHDSSIALLENGELVFAVQEERYTRIKADDTFPKNALRDCLKRYKLNINDIDFIIFYENPTKKYHRILNNCMAMIPNSLGNFMRGVCPWAGGKNNQSQLIQNEIKMALNLSPLIEVPPIFCTDHHLSHAASAFYPSPYNEAAILCVDGVGESESMSIWYGKGNKISKFSDIKYPHSLGLLYSAFTKYTGFKVNSGEYKLMGLAPYGRPVYAELIKEKLMTIHEDGSYLLNLKYFSYQNGKKMINHRFERLFGRKSRNPESEITQHEMDIASSIQLVINEIILKLANKIHSELNTLNLCMAGGVALNCVANGYIAEHGPFKNIWIQPAAGDAGGSVGAAYLVWHDYLNHKRKLHSNADSMKGAYLGPDFSDDEIARCLDSMSANYKKYSLNELTSKTAHLLSEGNVIGWFQGRMEFGPRALGNRSILGDPRSPKMQSTMNLKIKYRESFRPLAPSILAEHAYDYFSFIHPSPYMLFVNKIREAYRVKIENKQKDLFGLELLALPRTTIPAITHVDYSARIQTVHSETNPIYHQLIKEFYALTNCPLLINTSFNVRGEPMVCSPKNAYDCFMSTEMDYCVIGSYLLAKIQQSEKNRKVAVFPLD